MNAVTPRRVTTPFDHDLYRPLDASADPLSHRRNLIYWIKFRRRHKRSAFRPYHLVRSYLKATLQLGGKRMPMQTALRTLFGPIPGQWLYSKLYTGMTYEHFERTFKAFEDPFVPISDNPKPYIPPIEQVKAERIELIKAQRQFRRDEQHANRVALIASLRAQAGPVAPRGYAHRWYREHTEAVRHDRVSRRFEHLFGDRAARILDNTNLMPRQLLAQMLEDLDREEIKKS